MIETAIYSLLTGNANIATIISNRLYPLGDVPDKPTLPFATQTRIGTAHTNRTHSGKTYNTKAIQIDCYATTPFLAKQLAETIDTEIDNYKGVVGSWKIEALFVQDVRDYYEAETKSFVCSIDILIWAKVN